MLITQRDKIVEDVKTLAEKYGINRSALLPILQGVQKKYGRITGFAMQVVADTLGIHPVEVYGVVSFYNFLSEKPQGKFVIRLCRTISCDMAGKSGVTRQLEADLGIGFGQSTQDGMFSLEWANCLGMCDQGPALLVNEEVFTRVTPEKVHDILESCKKRVSPHATEERRSI